MMKKKKTLRVMTTEVLPEVYTKTIRIKVFVVVDNIYGGVISEDEGFDLRLMNY